MTITILWYMLKCCLILESKCEIRHRISFFISIQIKWQSMCIFEMSRHFLSNAYSRHLISHIYGSIALWQFWHFSIISYFDRHFNIFPTPQFQTKEQKYPEIHSYQQWFINDNQSLLTESNGYLCTTISDFPIQGVMIHIYLQAQKINSLTNWYSYWLLNQNQTIILTTSNNYLNNIKQLSK